MSWPEILKLAAQVTSILVALLALFIGLRNEARNQRRFRQQLAQGRKLARAAAKPLLSVAREGYENDKAIVLINHGPGTAVITEIEFRRGKKRAIEAGELIEFDAKYDLAWNEDTVYCVPYHLAGKSVDEAFRITVEQLAECGVPAQSKGLMDDIQAQLDEITIKIAYEDIFGSKFNYIDNDQGRPEDEN